MGLFGSKKQKEWRTHSWKSRLAYAGDMHKAKKQMTKKQYNEYQRRIKENIFTRQVTEKWRKEGKTVQVNPNSPKLKKFIIG